MIYKTKAERRQERLDYLLKIVRNKKFIIAVIVIIVLFFFSKIMSVPGAVDKKWKVNNEDAFYVAGVDVTVADAETLIGLSSAKHSELYGEVDEEDAYSICVKLLKQLYGDLTEEDYPLYICENSKANAWVVYTTPEEGEVPGVVAINMSTGEVYLIRHAL